MKTNRLVEGSRRSASKHPWRRLLGVACVLGLVPLMAAGGGEAEGWGGGASQTGKLNNDSPGACEPQWHRQRC
ncbi:MAG TPA: hypothetical protein VJ828_01385, partial [Lacipirellulaceae bacterium]|nr:hypothetical protein [Lacipirellulaceae bacterium]